MPKYKDSPEIKAAKKEWREKLREVLSLLEVRHLQAGIGVICQSPVIIK